MPFGSSVVTYLFLNGENIMVHGEWLKVHE